MVSSTKVAAKQVALAHFATALAATHEGRIVAFAAAPQARSFLVRRLPRVLRRRTQGLLASAIYADDTRLLVPGRRHLQESERLISAFLSERPTPAGLETYSVRGVHVGDLVYDEYLNIGHVTVDFSDPLLQKVLVQMTLDVILLVELFGRWTIAGVVSQGLAFRKGIPLRVAVALGIPAYAVAYGGTHRIDENDPEPNQEWRRYPERFASLPAEHRKKALAEAEGFIEENILRGRQRHAPDLSGRGAWQTAAMSAEDAVSSARPAMAERPTILVAVHSFTDSPHAPGVGLFPDYLLWIEHLADVARRTDYRWFVKPHPDQRDDLFGATTKIEALIDGVPGMELLPPSVGHRELLDGGLDLALTMYGTIGFEMPLFGVPVITALPNNPHHRYGYCLHPQTVAEHDELLLDPARWRYPIERHEILEYVYCAYLDRSPSVALDEVGRRRLSGRYFEEGEYFEEWDRNVTVADTREILADYSAWIASGTYSHREFLATPQPRSD